jgi:hypothetical protein
MFGTYDDWKTRSDRDDEVGYWEENYTEEPEPEDHVPQIHAVRFTNLAPVEDPEWFEQIVVSYYWGDTGPAIQTRRFFFPFKG